MEEKQEFQALMARLDENSSRQTRYGKWQCILTAAAALCCALALAVVCLLIPRVMGMLGQLDAVLENLEGITAELEQADLAGMVRDVDSLAVTSEEGIQAALDKLSAIDFETLNRAIENLSDVVEPLAKFFNIFNKS